MELQPNPLINPFLSPNPPCKDPERDLYIVFWPKPSYIPKIDLAGYS